MIGGIGEYFLAPNCTIDSEIEAVRQILTETAASQKAGAMAKKSDRCLLYSLERETNLFLS
ncbi:MAG: hypothetical protein VR65_04365 [Desulfobulbaceae bacterium BRH_c16a]|nr:MAG: hypothetical protein VR65_04365 [Desulfobulbaceae bacterium BRH_c16a]